MPETGIIKAAHDAGLAIHTWTFRSEPKRLASDFKGVPAAEYKAYLALGIANEAQTAAAVLGHNFPDSQWYKDAYTLLRSGGLEPREEAGSWISRAFRGMTRTVGLGG